MAIAVRGTLAAAVTTLLLVSVTPAVAQTGTVRGRVTIQGTDRPIPSAQVILDGTNRTVQTDNDGRYQLSNVPGIVDFQVRPYHRPVGTAEAHPRDPECCSYA